MNSIISYLSPQAQEQAWAYKAERLKARAGVQELQQERNSLLAFTRHTMPEYDKNWHHELVCDYLDKFARLEIKRLMVFMPPRHGKSELVSRRLPAFILGRNPDAPIIAASYGADLARRMNRDVQRIIDSPKYQEVFPNTRLSGSNVRTLAQGGTWLRNSDTFEVVEYNGYYRGAGVGGAITGMGMLYGIVDDPIKNRKEADSLTIRNSIWDWYMSTFRTRLAPGGGILITVTRWHEDDLAGRLLDLALTDLKADQWTVISLPAVAEEPTASYDPRSQNEPLWSSRFDTAEMEATQASVSEYEWNALYQQRPKPKEGATFKRDWWQGRNRYDPNNKALINSCIARWLSIDTAMKDKAANDPSAFSVVELLPDYHLVLRFVKRERLQFPFLVSEIETLAHRFNGDGKLRGVVIEDKVSGTSAYQTLMAGAPDWLRPLLVAFLPRGSKEYRDDLAAVWCKRDCVLLPYPDEAAPWLFEFEQELFSDTAAHDDMRDTFSQIIIYLENYLAAGWHAREGHTAVPAQANGHTKQHARVKEALKGSRVKGR